MVKSLEQQRREGAERKAQWRSNNPDAARTRNRIDNRQYRSSPQGKANERDPRRAHYRRGQAAKKGGYMPPLDSEQEHPRPADGRCECCGVQVGADKLVFDHDHQFIGQFFGWCCQACNKLGDNIARLQARIAYLKKQGL
jgi:Recombination endonuclease VII